MSTRKINLEGDYITFERKWSQGKNRLLAKVGANTPKGNYKEVHIQLNFECLSYILPHLREAWASEKNARIAHIEDIDKALGL